jgi:peroxiredoxin
MPLDRGERAPAFRLRGIDNEYWILGEPDRRRCVLLVFLRRDVPACRTLLSFIERLNRRSRTQEAEVIGISLDDQRDTLEFAEDYTFTFPVLVETPDRATFADYRVQEVPTLYLLGADLAVLDSLVGWSKDGFERLAQEFVRRSGALPASLWEAGDVAPEAAPARMVGSSSRRTGASGT